MNLTAHNGSEYRRTVRNVLARRTATSFARLFTLTVTRLIFMKARIIVKRGNPILLTDTTEIDRTLYAYLREYVDNAGGIDEIILGEHRLVTKRGGDFIPSPYPKNANMAWVFERIDSFNSMLSRARAYKGLKRVKEFLKLAEKLVKDGGSVTVEFDDVVIRYGTFTGRMGNYGALPDVIKDDIEELISASKNIDL